MTNEFPEIDWRAVGIDIPPGRTSGSVKVLCPKCSHNRKPHNQRNPCLSVNLDKGVWNCFNCGWKGPEKGHMREHGGDWRRMTDVDDRKPAKVYRLPPEPKPQPSDHVESFFRARGISRETWETLGVYFDGKSLCFPYYRDGVVIDIKHRVKHEGGKRFWREPDAELTFYGLDHVDQDAETVVIVEGEIDLMALHEAGIGNVLSVPNGAPPVESDIATAELEYMPSGEAIFHRARRVILAGDMDAPGERLMEEMARRIGKSKCYRVHWPGDQKDANETLLAYGAEGVIAAIGSAEPFPVEGITEPSDYLADLWQYEGDVANGEPIVEWPGFSRLVRFSEGQLTIVTGTPGSGKSVFLNALMMHKAMGHNWRIGVFSAEYQPTSLHVRDLVELYLDKPMNQKFNIHATRSEVEQAVAAITDKFRFILPPKPTLEDVMYRAQALVYREGIKGLVIDPWTELDQARPSGMSATDWVDECLKRIRRFGREYGVHVWVVAHPAKMRPETSRDGKRTVPVVTPYDISDSRHWYEMADVILSVWRDKSNPDDPVHVHVQKVRFRDNGELGVAQFHYNRVTRRYSDVTPTTLGGDPAGDVPLQA